MKMFEAPRVIQQAPTFQFHFEMTEDELIRLRSDLMHYRIPATTRWFTKQLVEKAFRIEIATPPSLRFGEGPQ